MAPETANQKRKRGRPTNASRDNIDASESQLGLSTQDQPVTAPENSRDADVDGASRPRKRGRPSNAGTSRIQPEPELKVSQPQQTTRKRVPLAVVHTNHGGGGNQNAEREPEPELDPTQPRKRGRPKGSRKSDNVGEGEKDSRSNPISENAPKKKPGRPPKEPQGSEDNQAEASEADDENEGNSSLLRRSGRVRRSPDLFGKGAREVVNITIEEASSNQKSKGREKTAHPQTIEIEREARPQPKKKRGRPSLNNHVINEVEGNTKSKNQPKKNAAPPGKEKRKKSLEQPSQEQDASIQEDNRPGANRSRQANKAASRSGRHRQSSEAQDRSSSPDSAGSPPRYRHLATRTRRVPRNVIESKWTPLEAPALSSVATLLQSTSRPVLLRINNQQRHSYATSALNAVSNRLRSKISRGLPFPPATTSTRREEEFEFERTISGIQNLESQLDPLLHSVELLRREKERAEKELDHEYKVLSRLGANARAEARERRDQMRKMHVLVPEKPPTPYSDDYTGGVETAAKGSGRAFAGLVDEELAGLAGQIANHMDSMRGNLQQIDGVVPAIAKSQGLLRAALQSHLDREQLETVILG